MWQGDGPALGDEEGRAQRLRMSARVQCVARRLPVLLIVGGLAFDFGTPPRYTAAPFFAAATLVAAALCSLRATMLTVLAAVVSEFAVVILHRNAGYEASLTEVATVLVVALLALGLNRVVRLREAELASVRDVAEATQRALLPAPPERIAGLSVAARYVGARADALVGGDLYAVQETPYGVRLIVADVRGKGLEAVAAAAIVIGVFREAAGQEATLEAVAGRLERALQQESARHTDPDRSEEFATAVLAELPTDGSPRLRLLNRGHPAPLLLTADGEVRELSPTAPALPLGMGDVAGWPDRPDETSLPGGALLLFFTDGVTEARDGRDRFYDPCVRLRGGPPAGPDGLLDTLIEDVGRHTGGATADDMALLAVQRPMGA
ncbi:PP2C family protein-serine/threonine phosphatase [Streptomyces sioyaensis]|uniref:PP2C family protein-serine/threonine phosphatase n=1 Tax=Streptomyces sioyaensis TaxID=67364 RepID=UPI003D733F6A